jgi:hypothetical protein
VCRAFFVLVRCIAVLCHWVGQALERRGDAGEAVEDSFVSIMYERRAAAGEEV